MAAVIVELERRNKEHFDILSEVVKQSTVNRMVKAYYREVQDLTGGPDDLLNALPAQTTREGVMAVIMGHLDLRLMARATFKPDEVSVLTNIDARSVTAALTAASLPSGSLAEPKAEHLFLDNPVWDAPCVSLGEVLFIPQFFFSHVHRIFDRLAAEADIKTELENRRAAYLEEKLEKDIAKGMPGAKISTSVKWKCEEEQLETDLIAVL